MGHAKLWFGGLAVGVLTTVVLVGRAPRSEPAPRAPQPLDSRSSNLPPRTGPPLYWSGVWANGADHSTREIQVHLAEHDGVVVLLFTQHELPRVARSGLSAYELHGRWDTPGSVWVATGEGVRHSPDGTREQLHEVTGEARFTGEHQGDAHIHVVTQDQAWTFIATGVGDRNRGFEVTTENGRSFSAEDATLVEAVHLVMMLAREKPEETIQLYLRGPRVLVCMSFHSTVWGISFSGPDASLGHVVDQWMETAFPDRRFAPDDFIPLQMSNGVRVEVPHE